MARPINPELKETLICEKCKKHFTRYKSESNYEHVFCSRKCSDSHPTNEKGRTSIFKCENCAKEFKRSMAMVERRTGQHRYCSRKCNGQARAKNYIDDKHPQWKGDSACYVAIHTWIRRKLGNPELCIHCGAENNLDWANKSHEYKRDIYDWIPLCKSCHSTYDGILNKAWKTRKGELQFQ